VPRDDGGVVREWEKEIVDGGNELAGVASGEVGAAYGSAEECVSCEKECLLGEVEADTALGMAGGVEDGAGEAGDGDDFTVVEGVVRGGNLGGGDAKPGGLDVHHLDEREVELVVEDGSASEMFEAVGSGDVVDVSMGDDNLFNNETMSIQNGCNAGDFIAGVDDDGFAGCLVAKYGAIATERADNEDFVDHGEWGPFRFLNCLPFRRALQACCV